MPRSQTVAGKLALMAEVIEALKRYSTQTGPVEELQAKTASPLVVEGDIEVMAPPAL